MLASISKNNEALYATSYDRAKCDIGVVHLGYGGFHRAHQAVYIDDYMQCTNDLRWGIAAVNLRASEAQFFEQVQKAENGYLLTTTTPDDVREMRLVRPHCQFLDWSKNTAEAENIVARSSVTIITITVTESGYYLNDDTTLNIDDPIIAQEIVERFEGRGQQSIYAYLSRALHARYQANGLPINILCCDNIRSNGKMLDRNFKKYLEVTGEHDLLGWIEENVSFPCSMVDRITPRTSEALAQETTELFGSVGLNPINSEAFKQWVVEDNFKAPMPDLPKVGTEFVVDVDPYEEAKIRILNGGHTGICYLGALAGHKTFDQAIRDPMLRVFFDNFETKEVLPGLDMPLPFNKSDYLLDVVDRFSNRAIADQLERICMDGYSKIPIYIRPTLESCLRQNIMPKYCYECIASWYVYARHFAAGKMPIHYHEPYWDQLKPLLAVGAEEDFARNKQLWADLPEKYSNFIDNLVLAIKEMDHKWQV